MSVEILRRIQRETAPVYNSTSCVPQVRASLQELFMCSLTGGTKQGEFSEVQGDG